MHLRLAMVFALLAGAAIAKDREFPKEDHPPFNPFEKAEVGDWVAFNDVESLQKERTETTVTWRVTSVTEDEVVVSEVRAGKDGLAQDIAESIYHFSKKTVPSLGALIGWRDEPRTWGYIDESRSSDEFGSSDARCTVGGKEFDCKRLSFMTNGHDNQVTLWVSADVKAPGIVKATEIHTLKDWKTWERELAGFGNGEKAEWGRMPAEKVVPQEGALPFNPFASAQHGDWASYVRTPGSFDRASMQVTYVVGDAMDEKINLAECELTPEGQPQHCDLTRWKRGVPSAAQSYPPFLPVEGLVIAGAEKAKHTVEGKEFDCTKVILKPKPSAREKKMVTLWLSPEVRCNGIVEAVEEVGGVEKLRLRIVGYGNGEKADWGKKVDEAIPPAVKR